MQIKLYSIIYELIDQVKDAMAGLLDPEERESEIGRASVKQVFKLTKFPVAGCMVDHGRIERNARARVIRGQTPIYDGGIQTLKRFQDEVKEVPGGQECGMAFANYQDIRAGDVIECFQVETVQRTL